MKKSSPLKVVLIVLLVLLLAAGGAVGYLYSQYSKKIQAVSTEDIPTAFLIEEGQSMNQVINNLYNHGLINDIDSTKIYVKLNKVNNYYAGNFILNKNMSVEEIMNTLSDVSKAFRTQVKVTIAPGDWAKHAAKAIAEVTNLKEEDILDAWSDIAFCEKLINKYEFLTDEIFNSEHSYLEGYLMPETYYIYEETTIEQVTTKILDQTNSVYQKYKQDILKSNYSVHQLMTLSSVIIFEANGIEDMKLVSGVFANRFKNGMKMQSSVTVCYALYEYSSWTECERKSLVTQSPYNTYLVDGLPVGPVCNPSEDAIVAALNPTESDYFYFIADFSTGRCVFAKTYAEHVANIKKYLK